MTVCKSDDCFSPWTKLVFQRQGEMHENKVNMTVTAWLLGVLKVQRANPHSEVTTVPCLLVVGL